MEMGWVVGVKFFIVAVFVVLNRVDIADSLWSRRKKGMADEVGARKILKAE